MAQNEHVIKVLMTVTTHYRDTQISTALWTRSMNNTQSAVMQLDMQILDLVMDHDLGVIEPIDEPNLPYPQSARVFYPAHVIKLANGVIVRRYTADGYQTNLDAISKELNRTNGQIDVWVAEVGAKEKITTRASAIISREA